MSVPHRGTSERRQRQYLALHASRRLPALSVSQDSGGLLSEETAAERRRLGIGLLGFVMIIGFVELVVFMCRTWDTVLRWEILKTSIHEFNTAAPLSTLPHGGAFHQDEHSRQPFATSS